MKMRKDKLDVHTKHTATWLHRAGAVCLLLLGIALVQACEGGGEERSQLVTEADIEPLGDYTEVSHLQKDDKIIIGLAMGTLREERWQKDRDLFREAAEALGAEVMVTAANEDGALQIRQVES